jgi:hypothetical protein
MSSFTAQRIVNNFPLWTKVRTDPSSLGYRIASVFAEYNDAFLLNLRKNQQDFNLNTKSLGFEWLWSIELEESDFVTNEVSRGGLLNYTFNKSVTADDAHDSGIELTRKLIFEDFLFSEPTRLVQTETIAIEDITIWDSDNPTVLNDISYPEFLAIRVYNSTTYNKNTQQSDRLFNNKALVLLEGFDINLKPIKEVVNITDDGIYSTYNIWSSFSALPKIVGFDGKVLISYKTPDAEFVVDPYRIAVLTDVEGPLHLFLEDEHLVYATPRFKSGVTYRNGSVVVDNTEVLGYQKLMDDSSVAITPVDIAINPRNGYLYALDDDAHIHVYDHGLSRFTQLQENSETKDNLLSLIPLQRYVKLDSVERLWTHHQFVRENIYTAVIKRISPTGTINYLQSDKTWGVGTYSFSGEANAKLPELSWQDFVFENEYDDYGQWDFYITTTSATGTKVFQTSVLCDSLEAIVSIDLETIDQLALFFSQDARLTTYDGVNFHFFKELFDFYYLDPETQRMFFVSDYDNVEIS